MIDEKKLIDDLYVNNSDKITELLRLSKIKTSKTTKIDKIELLINYLKDDKSVQILYNNLSDMDKELVDHIVNYNYNPDYDIIRDIYNKYDNTKPTYSLFERKSKARLLRINDEIEGYIYPAFRKNLELIVKKEEVVIEPTDEKFFSFDCNILEDLNIIDNIDLVIDYINKNKVVVNKKQQISKAVALKIIKYSDINDFLKKSCDNEEIEIEKAKNIEEFFLLYPVINMLQASQICYIDDKYMKVNNSVCSNYLTQSKVGKAKFLLNSYIESNFINEFDRFKCFKMNYYYSKIKFKEGRKLIIDYIKSFEINKWFDVDYIKRETRKNNHIFLRNEISNVNYKNGYYFYSVSHKLFEFVFIDHMFIDYLFTLGLVDVAYNKIYSDDIYSQSAAYFRITDFGAEVFGLKEEIKKEVKDDKFVITDDFKILINRNSIVHSLFFEKFLSKDGNDYIINAEGISTALNSDIELDDIIKYLIENSKEMPFNVMDQLMVWKDNYNNIIMDNSIIVKLDCQTYEKIFSNKKVMSIIENFGDNFIIINKDNEKKLKNYLFSINQLVIDKKTY